MKVRLEDQRIVYRLSEIEKEVLIEKGEFGISLSLSNSLLSYKIRVQATSNKLSYIFKDEVFTMLLPKVLLDRWDEEKVGFEEKVGDLNLVVEKDLKRSKKRVKS